MKAEVKWFHSPDLLSHGNPTDPKTFMFLLQVMVGPKGEEGEEAFNVVVCTPSWLENELRQHQGGIHGRHYFFVREFDIRAIEAQLQREIEALEAPDWDALAEKIGGSGGGSSRISIRASHKPLALRW